MGVNPFLVFYGLRTISIMTTNPMIIATNRAAIAGKKYVSTADAGAGVGAAVAAGASFTMNASSPTEPKYPPEPAKVAYT